MATETDIGDTLSSSSLPKPRARPFDGYANAKPNWIRIAAVISPFVLWAVLFFIVTAAHSLGGGQ